jgi:hypothetical protein
MNWGRSVKKCKEAVVATFKILSRHVPGGTEENNEYSRDNRSLGRDLNLRSREYDAGVPTNQTRRSPKMFFR